MTPPGIRLRYSSSNAVVGTAIPMPIVPITLSHLQSEVVDALLDTGASINVMPFGLGLRLGCDWSKAMRLPPVSGNLASVETRGIILHGKIGSYTPVRLAFGWVKTDDVPVLLGQENFFKVFDVCFFGSISEFEIRPKP